MGGSSSSSSSQTQTTDNSQKTYIDDTRAAVYDQGVAITGTTGAITYSDLSPDVAAELRKAGEAGFDLSADVLKLGFDFANQANKSVQELAGTVSAVAKEATEEDAKQFLTDFVKWGLLASVSVAALFFWSKKG
ncbi:hypothetical protein [Hwanghaeella sp. LZ110]|uniref:hypothetical protein n=1 Tax=Hwanghaeella sp. LZ110 TaxID=3402810 RepID=UPI003B67B57F